MRINKILILGISLIVALSSCEVPNKPNFSIDIKNDLPLLKNKRFYMLGGSDAFIDTTQGKIDTLFSTNAENVLFISFTDSVQIGDLEDAIPSVNVNPSALESEVGTIEIDDFSADFSAGVGKIEQSPQGTDPVSAEIGTIKPEFNGTGATSFNEITGQNPPVVSSPLLAGNTQIQVSVDAGSFVSATIQSGGLAISFSNSLGFDIASMNAQLISDADANSRNIGTPINLTNINHGSTQNGVFTFSEDEVLETDLQIQLTINWINQNYQVNSTNSLSLTLSEDALEVKQAVAEIPAQSLSPTTPNIEINDNGFVSVVMSDSQSETINALKITLKNGTNLPLSNADFNSFPTITLKNSKGEILDAVKSLIPVNPSGNFLGSNETATVVFNLAGAELTKVLSYNLNLGTVGSQGGAIAVNNTDAISIEATTTNMEVSIANAVIDAQNGIDLRDEAGVEGDFVQVQVNDGSLNMTFKNDLEIPMVIENLTIQNKNAFVAKNTSKYFASGSVIGQLNNITIDPKSSTTASINLAGKAVSDVIEFLGTASSPGSNGATAQMTEFDEIGIGIVGSLSVQSATSRLKPQIFSTADSIEIDKDNFLFTNSDQYIKLKSGELRLENLVNSLDVQLDTLLISVYSIVNEQGEPLVISFMGDVRDGLTFIRLRRKENNERPPIVIDLSDYYIKAVNNVVKYEIYGATEDSRLSDEPFRTISATDKVSASLSINNLQVGSALGRVIPKSVILGTDALSNGKDILDISADDEAEIIENDGIGDLGDKLNNLKLTGSNLSIQYTTNLGVKASIIMAIAGVKEDGSYLFMQGKNENAVLPDDDISKMYYNGVPIDRANLVKFTFGVNATTAVESYKGTVSFNETNSNVDDFLAELPATIRTLGFATINADDDVESFLANPIQFDTKLGIEIPLSISTENGPLEISQDFEQDLTSVPGEDDTIILKEMSMALRYINNLPLGIKVDFIFQDSLKNPVVVDYEPIELDAAEIDANGYTSVPSEGSATLKITNATQLNKVYNMSLKLSTETSGGVNVKIRANDYIEIGINGSATGQFKVN